MAIVTIGQIKHRRGILGTDPMPQLASAELGWGVDLQELYIGNGTISEGAPAEGNTEILTEHTDLVALLDNYVYDGPFSGADMQTGPLIGTPVERLWVERFDDNVSVRAFGALGDGVTDDIEAIERALNQHAADYPLDNRYWTTVYFPAGTYVISRPLAIPGHVRIIGDGMESSIISMSSADTEIVQIAEFLYPDAVSRLPTDIHIAGIGLVAQQPASSALQISDATNLLFERVGFIGASVDTEVVGSSNCGVVFNNTSNRTSNNIRFSDCAFESATYGIASGVPNATLTNQILNDIRIVNCRFYDLYEAIIIGNEVDVTYDPPSNWSILHNSFDLITMEGIHTYEAKRITSGHNHFADVGNGQSAATPMANVIFFGDTGGENPIDTIVDLTDYEGNYSIGDVFDRDDADNATYLRVNTNCLNSYAIDSLEITWGTLKVEPGRLILLADNTAAPITTGIVLDTKYQGAVIDYQLNRGLNQVRTGTLEIANGTTTAAMSDAYTEAGPVGVTLSIVDNGAGEATIEYISTDDANDIVLSYSIRHLTCLPAVPTASP